MDMFYIYPLKSPTLLSTILTLKKTQFCCQLKPLEKKLPTFGVYTGLHVRFENVSTLCVYSGFTVGLLGN